MKDHPSAHFHDLPHNSKIEEAIIGSLSWGQLLWLVPSFFISFQIARYSPLLPFESPVFARLHWAIPVAIALIFMTMKHPRTNLTLSKYLILMIKFKFKRKKFLYQRENYSKLERALRKGELLLEEKTGENKPK